MISNFLQFNFSFDEVTPDSVQILDFLHSSDLEKEHPAVVFVNNFLSERHETKIVGGYIIKEIEPVLVKKGTIKVDGTNLTTGRQICAYLKGATQVALFLCTAGEFFTKKTNKLNNSGDIMEAFIVDAIGSLTVENAMNKIQDSLSESLFHNGLKITNRYSPGYCNWQLTDQKELFQLIGENPTGITINASCLMTPRKSVSGIIGIGEDVKKREYGCKICKNTDCIYRKMIHQEKDDY